MNLRGLWSIGRERRYLLSELFPGGRTQILRGKSEGLYSKIQRVETEGRIVERVTEEVGKDLTFGSRI